MVRETRALLTLFPKFQIDTKVFWWTLPLSMVLASYFSAESFVSINSLFTWLLVGFLGHIAMAPFVAVAIRSRSSSFQILLALFMGAVRGLVTTLFVRKFDLHDPLSLNQRVANSTIVVFYWFYAGGLVLRYGAEFKQHLSQMLKEMLDKNLIANTQQAKSSSLFLIEKIRILQEGILESLKQNPSSFTLSLASREIDNFIEKEVRPLSYSTWKKGTEQRAVPNLFLMIKRSLALNPIPALPIMILMLPLTLVTQFSTLGVPLTIFLQSISFLTISLLSHIIYKHSSNTKTFQYRNLLFLSSLAIPFFIALIINIASGLRGFETMRSALFAYSLNYVAQVSLYLCSLLLLDLNKSQSAVVDHLANTIRRGEFNRIIETSLEGAGDQRLAQFMHAEVQSQLLACKILLEKAARGDLEAFSPGVVQDILTRMDTFKLPLFTSEEKTFDEVISEFIDSWRGIADIKVVVYPKDVSHRTLSSATEQLLEEAIVNSIRHGKATAIEIHCSQNQNTFQFNVTDNGSHFTADRGGGLGSVLFEAFATRWSLQRIGTTTQLRFEVAKL